MTHPTEILTRAGISNPSVHEFVDGWARILEPDRIEVVDAGADERLPQPTPNRPADTAGARGKQ